MAGNNKDQQSSAPLATEPEETAAAQQQSAPPPAPEEEPAQAQAPEQDNAAGGPPQAGAGPAADTPAPAQDPDPAEQKSPADADGQEPEAEPAAAAEQTPEEQAPAAKQSAPAAEGPPAEDKTPAAGGPAAEDAPPAGDGGPAAAESPAQTEAGPAAEAGDTAGEDGEAESEEERRRVIEMTRTVQLSLEQIMARMADAGPSAADLADEELSGEDTAPAPQDVAAAQERRRREEPSLGRRIGRAAGSGVLSITRWLLLVVFFVALIAAVGIAFLYRGATRDLIPKVEVTLGGQTVQPTSYEWNVPVVNHLFSRRYHEVISEEPLPLKQAVEGIRPELVITPQDFEAELTLKDSGGNELFSGPVFSFAEYTFEKDGTYTAELTVVNHASRFDVNAVEGTQSYDFTFDITLHPTVRLDSSSVLQGDIVAVVASSIPLNDKPDLTCDFENPGFMPAQDGWIAYVPIPADAEPGEYSFAVHSSSHDQTLTLKVHERAWRELPLTREEDLHWAYVGPDNTPPAVEQVLKQNEETIYWRDEGFAMPYDFEVTPELEFGTLEIVNNGIGTTRRSINTVATLPIAWYGSDLLAPAAGRVVLAEDLGGEYSAEHDMLLPNKTLVIDHGGGIKTVYYNLRSIDAAVGDIVEQGQKIGTSQLTVCIGAYVGEVPVDAQVLWQGSCNAVKYY